MSKKISGKMKRKIAQGIFLVGLFGIALAGTIADFSFKKSAEENNRKELVRLVNVVDAAVNSNRVATLQGKKEDEKNPDYVRLREQFLSLGKSLERFDVRWVYLMRKENEKWIFLVDSVDESSPDHSKSGDEYTEYPRELNSVLENPDVLLIGPYSDRWGEFMSAFVSVKDNDTGEIVGVLGLDMNRSVWKKNIFSAQIFPVTMTGFLIVFWVSFFLYHFRRVNAEKEFRIKEAQLESVTENIQDVVYRVNAKGIITYISPAVHSLLGFFPSEIEGRSIAELFPLEARAQVMRDFEESFRTKNAESVLTTLYDKNGIAVRTDITGVFIHEGELGMEFQGVIREITEEQKVGQRMREQAEELQSSQKAILNVLEDVEAEREKSEQEREKMDAILRSIGDGVFVVNRDMDIVMVNEVTARLSGYSQKELLGKKYFERLKFVHENDGGDADMFVTEVIRTGEVKEMANHTVLVKKQGEQIPVADSAAPLKDKKGAVIGCVVVFRDATKEREINKMKSEFVSVASHQLRTPLTSIKWFAELLSDDAHHLSLEQRDYVNEIRKGNDRLIDLVNDLLNVSRIETGKNFKLELKATDIFDLFDSVIREQIASAEVKNIKVTLERGNMKTLSLLVDGDKLRQVFQNFLSNAIKYSPEGGDITLGCSEDEKTVTVFFRDSGIGIPLDQQARVFEKFFRASNVLMTGAEGTGLGLYIAKSIIEAHKGEIWFESEENRGTTFFVRFPK